MTDPLRDKDQTANPGVQSDVQDTSSINPPAVKREAEVAGTAVRSEIVKDQEVRDAGVIENPAPPESAPPVQIPEGLIEKQPSSNTLATQSITSIGQAAQKEVLDEPPVVDFDKAVKILKENHQVIPFGAQGSGVFQAGVVVHQDRRSKEIKRIAQILSKAA